MTEDALRTLNFSFSHVCPTPRLPTVPQPSVHRCISCETISFEMQGDARATRDVLSGAKGRGPGPREGQSPPGCMSPPRHLSPESQCGVCWMPLNLVSGFRKFESCFRSVAVLTNNIKKETSLYLQRKRFCL